jgi:hypothetical protein
MKYLLLLLLSLNAIAQDVVTVKKGDTVPFDGVLFTKEKELEVRKEVLEKDFLQKKASLLEELGKVQKEELDISNKRIEIYQARAQEMADREVKSESREFLKNALYFTAGAVLTGVLGYGVIQAYR